MIRSISVPKYSDRRQSITLMLAIFLSFLSFSINSRENKKVVHIDWLTEGWRKLAAFEADDVRNWSKCNWWWIYWFPRRSCTVANRSAYNIWSFLTPGVQNNKSSFNRSMDSFIAIFTWPTLKVNWWISFLSTSMLK